MKVLIATLMAPGLALALAACSVDSAQLKNGLQQAADATQNSNSTAALTNDSTNTTATESSDNTAALSAEAKAVMDQLDQIREGQHEKMRAMCDANQDADATLKTDIATILADTTLDQDAKAQKIVDMLVSHKSNQRPDKEELKACLTTNKDAIDALAATEKTITEACMVLPEKKAGEKAVGSKHMGKPGRGEPPRDGLDKRQGIGRPEGKVDGDHARGPMMQDGQEREQPELTADQIKDLEAKLLSTACTEAIAAYNAAE